jgi:1,4-alpha-glucan branching enzyme
MLPLHRANGTVPADASGNNGRLSDFDVFLFRQGSHFRLHHRLGAHPVELDNVAGVRFSLWAPNAERVHVFGDFNDWRRDQHALAPRPDQSGIWEAFVPGVGIGALYKYPLVTRAGHRLDKADPFARAAELPPATASRVWRDDYAWGDDEWMQERGARNSLDSPMAIYELHLGSWRRDGDSPPRPLSYRELAQTLPDYIA